MVEMIQLTDVNVILIGREKYNAPREDNVGLWFEKRPDGINTPELWDLDFMCMNALFARGIGERKCPTPGRWASFVVSGGLVAALSGKYLVPDESLRLFPEADMSKLCWAEVWRAYLENHDVLSEQFMASMLRLLMPRFRSGASLSSNVAHDMIADMWQFIRYTDTTMHSVGNLRFERIEKGRKAFRDLSPEMVEAIDVVAGHMPTMLEISIKYLRKYYRW